MTKTLIIYLALLLAIGIMVACSELVEDIPSVPKVNTHGEGVYDDSSNNFHPNLIADSPNGMFDCQECHAADFSGGVTGVGCDTENCHPSIGVHVDGIVNPASEDFHGNYIREDNWDMLTCQPCHGEDYAGGMVSPTCNDCHTYLSGPENCTTCHGSPEGNNAPPRDLSKNTSNTSRGVGAHQAHLVENEIGRFVTCTQCHNVPGGVYVTGHIDDADNRAEVMMNEERANLVTNDPSTSNYDPDLGDPNNEGRFTPDPEYNSADLTCSNTYCHGYFKNGNLNNKPVWNDPSTSQCGSCHGDGTNPLPGGSHLNISTCYVCHGGVVDANQNIINPSKHIDGLLNLYGEDIKY